MFLAILDNPPRKCRSNGRERLKVPSICGINVHRLAE